MNDQRKAGPITFAIGLIVFGVLLLISNITDAGLFGTLYKYWPILLIGLGLEYFWRLFFNRKKGIEDTRFHIPTLLLIVFISALGFVGQQVDNALKDNDLAGFITETLGGTNYNYQRNFDSGPLEIVPGGKIRLNGDRSSVVLVPSADNKLYVKARITAWGPTSEDARKRAESFRVNIDQGSQVDISYVPDRTGNVRRPAEIEFRVMVPAGLEVSVENETGQIIGENLTANVKVRTVFGKIDLTGIAGNVNSSIVNGQAEFEDIKGNLDAEGESGSIKAVDVTGKVRAGSSTGKIEVISSRPVSTDYDITNTHGMILLRIPESSDAVLSAVSQAGSISGSLGDLENQIADENADSHPSTKGSVTLGSGKGKITISTETGSILLEHN